MTPKVRLLRKGDAWSHDEGHIKHRLIFKKTRDLPEIIKSEFMTEEGWSVTDVSTYLYHIDIFPVLGDPQ